MIALVLAAAAVSYGVFGLAAFGKTSEYAVICVDGEEYARYALVEISGQKTIEVTSEYGTNVVELSSNGARVTEASCLDKLDVKCGAISRAGQVIVCAPNRFSLRIEGGSSAVDMVTY